MRRRTFIATMSGAVLAWPPLARAQGRIPVIGWLTLSGVPQQDREAFRRGVRDLGYIENRNIRFALENVAPSPIQLAAAAARLVKLKVDVLVAMENQCAAAAAAATKSISIVMRTAADPIELGWAVSLSKPGRNVTGMYSQSSDLYAKRIELLVQVIPSLRRLAVIVDPEMSTAPVTFAQIQGAAEKYGIELQVLEVRDQRSLESAFQRATRDRADAFIAVRSPTVVGERAHLAALALKTRLPGIFDDRQFVEAGGLMSYGANISGLYYRAAYYVDKILKGVRAGEIPIERPTEIELFINQKSAKAIGLTIPQPVLIRANSVIE